MFSDTIKVSVIIPTFGKPVFLKKAIESVNNQTLRDIELIIVDDNNIETEERKLTEQLISSIEITINFTYIKHNNNKNGAVARNTGLKVAKGTYISFLDSDDEYLLDRLEKCYNTIEEQKEKFAGVYTGCKFKRNGNVYRRHTNVIDGSFIVQTLACNFMFSTGSNLFIKREVIDKLQGFDETFLRHQDYEFLVRLFEHHQLKAIPEMLVIKNNENFNLPDVHKMIAIKNQYLSKFRNIIESLPKEKQDYIFHHNYQSIAELALKTKNKYLAKEYYTKAESFMPLNSRNKLRKRVFQLKNIIS